MMEEVVTEEDYNALLATLSRTLGENDEYLEVFDDNMQYQRNSGRELDFRETL